MRQGNFSIPAIITGSYPLFKSGYIECKLIIKAQDWPTDDENSLIQMDDLLDLKNPIQLSGKTESGNDIWVSKVRFKSFERGSGKILPSSDDQLVLKGIAEFLIEGNLEEFDTSGDGIICYVSISPTRLALTRSMYTPQTDGTITRYGIDKRKGIQWRIPLGEAELLDNYEYLEAEEDIGLEVALARVQRCQITIKMPPCGIVSLKTVLADLNNVLEEPLLLLSFLSRKSIGWYEATAHPFFEANIPIELNIPIISEPRATARFYQFTERNNETNAYLTSILPLHRETLAGGVFQQLFDTYMLSPLKDTIRRTIEYLLISYERGYIEARLGIIYAALESLVDGLSKFHELTQLMNDSDFSKLSRVLRKIIKRLVLEQKIAEGVIKKLGELKRPAIKDRLQLLLQTYDLDKIKLKQSRTDVSSELQNILSRRNTYIHTGVMNIVQHSLDLYLLQELIELWLLKLLGCPSSSIFASGYSSIIP